MKVLIISDMLKDFMEAGGALYCGAKSRKIIPFIAQKIDEFRRSGNKIIYMCDAHCSDDKEFEMFGTHCVVGTKGAEVIDELKPGKDDIVIPKTTFSSVYGTRLEEELEKIKPETVYVVGVCTSICVMDMVGDLRVRGYKVVVYKDGVADFDPEAHEFALKRIVNVYGAEVK